MTARFGFDMSREYATSGRGSDTGSVASFVRWFGLGRAMMRLPTQPIFGRENRPPTELDR
jgi:hypothetical protein